MQSYISIHFLYLWLQTDQDWMWEEEAQKANASLLQEKLASLEDRYSHTALADFAASMKF